MKYITEKIIQTKKNIFLIFFFVVVSLLLPFSVTQKEGIDLVYRTNTIQNPIHFSLEKNTASAQAADTDSVLPPAGSGSELFNKGFRAVIGIIGNFLLFIGSIVLWAGGVFFEGAVKYLIVDFKDFSPLRVINDVWTVVRDACNLAFIFGFIYLGIKTIFDPDSAQTQRFLTKIIIGALLINFSLFFTKIVIDVTNFTAVTIYNEGTTAMGGSTIPGTVMSVLGMSSIFGGTDAEKIAGISIGGMFAYYFMAFIFLIVCGIVFFFVAIQLVTRFIVLIFVMIASPVLFAGAIFPKTEEYSSKLWSTLIAHSLYPAVFLFLAFISLKILDFTSQNVLSNNGNVKEALTQSEPTGFTEVVLLFIIAMVIFYQAHAIAKKISESGGSLSIKGAQSMAGKIAGGATAGLVARGLRATVGQRAHKMLNDKNLKARAELEGKEGDKARAQLMRAQKKASGTYDVRNVKIGGKSFGDRTGLGAGLKDSYKKQIDAKMKAEKEFAKILGHDEDEVTAAEVASKAEITNAETNVATIKNELKEETRADRAKLTEVSRHAHEVSVALKDATENLKRAETDEDRGAIQATIDSLNEQKKAHVNEINAINASIQNTTEGYQERITQAQTAVTKARTDKPEKIKEARGARQKAYADVVARGRGVTSRVAPLGVPQKLIPNIMHRVATHHVSTTHSNTFVAKELKDKAGKEATDAEKLAEQISGMQKKMDEKK